MLAILFGGVGAFPLASALFVVALACTFYARHWLVLARRSRVGARSEDEIRRALAPLRREGWRLRHSLPWRGRGDIDSVAIAPGGVAFAIQTKTVRYEDRHLAVVREQAAWLWRFRRRWRRHAVVPVLCIARARGVTCWMEPTAQALDGPFAATPVNVLLPCDPPGLGLGTWLHARPFQCSISVLSAVPLL